LAIREEERLPGRTRFDRERGRTRKRTRTDSTTRNKRGSEVGRKSERKRRAPSWKGGEDVKEGWEDERRWWFEDEEVIERKAKRRESSSKSGYSKLTHQRPCPSHAFLSLTMTSQDLWDTIEL